jgi:hypothetical protein
VVIQTDTAWPEGTHTLDELTVEAGATLAVAGGSHVTVSGTLTIRGNSTLLLQGKNTGAMVGGVWAGVGVAVDAGNATVEAGSRVTADGRGYVAGAGPGGAGARSSSGGTHGGVGGAGTWGAAPNPQTYGDPEAPVDLGSSGGGWNGIAQRDGGPGGGAIRLEVAGTLTLDGEISARGQGMATFADAGGGSGGSIWASASTLVGGGRFHAGGGSSASGRGGGGGGGRIAVHCRDGTGFTGFTGSTVSGGTGENPGEAGTMGFFDASTTPPGLRVSQRMVFAPGSAPHYQALTVDNGATVVLGGGALLAVDGLLSLTGNSALLVQSQNTAAMVEGRWAGVGGTVWAGEMTVAAGSRVTADGQGYVARSGPGGAGARSNCGGTHGGTGGRGRWGAPNLYTYGSPEAPADLGSGGGSWNGWGEGNGGAGGGAILLNIGAALTLDGEISARGQSMNSGFGDGAGSGGSILISAGTIAGDGLINANGGNSTSGADGGGGGGGRIAIHHWGSVSLPPANITAEPGAGEGTAQPGTVALADTPEVVWHGTVCLFEHGEMRIAYETRALDPGAHRAELVLHGVSQAGVQIGIGQGMPVTHALAWDTTTATDGLYELWLLVRDADGTVVLSLTRQLCICNAAAWHSGTVGADEVWPAGVLHLIDGALLIPAGVTLAVDAGAVAKATQGARIVVQDGGTFTAQGAAGAPVVLTAITDDTVGGDTNADGGATVPTPGHWDGILVQGSGQVITNAFVELRYATATRSGTLATDERWLGGNLYRVMANLVVPADLTLTLDPGVVVKMAPGTSILVQTDGALLAAGTVAQPVVITSERDDAVGGDANGDGASTTPGPGDWKRIHLDGGRAVLDHCDIRYGAGPDATNDALIRTSGGAAQLALSNSRLADGFYTGVLCWGGTAIVTNTVVTGMDRGVSAHPNGTLQLVNCTLDDNRLGALVHGGSLALTNCIVSHSAQYGVDWNLGDEGPAVRYCDVWGSAVADFHNHLGQPNPGPGVEGVVSADPDYRDRARGDFRLGYVSPCIDAGDGTVAPATDCMGAPRYDDPRTPDTGVPMPGPDEALAVPDLGAYEFVETAESAIDLVVTQVVGPAQVTAGETVSLEWTVRNHGTGTAVGPWHDRVALVRDPDTDPVPILAGEVLIGAGLSLGPGQSLAASGTIRVPGSTATPHRWQVTTNARGEVFEGTRTANNVARSAAGVALSVPDIPVGGEAVAGTAHAAGESFWYQVVLPATDVVISLECPSGTAGIELYGAVGYVPDREHFGYRRVGPADGAQHLFVPAAEGGVCYVLVYVRSLSGAEVEFALAAVEPGFGVTTVSPSEAGDCGVATITVQGGCFTQECTCALVASDGTPFPAAATVVWGTTRLEAIFETQGVPQGEYAFRVDKNGTTAELPAAVTITACHPAEMWFDIVGRPTIRAGGRQTYRVSYGNRGNVDLPETYVMLGTEGPLHLLQASDPEVQVSDLGDGEGSLLSLALPRIGAQQSAAFDLEVEAGLATGTGSVSGFAFLGHHAHESASGLPDPTVDVAPELLSQTADRMEMALHVTSAEVSGDLSCVFTREPVDEARELSVIVTETEDEREVVIEYTEEPGSAGPLFGARGGERGAAGMRDGWDQVIVVLEASLGVVPLLYRSHKVYKTIQASKLRLALADCLWTTPMPNSDKTWLDHRTEAGYYGDLRSFTEGDMAAQTIDVGMVLVRDGGKYWSLIAKAMGVAYVGRLKTWLRNSDPAKAALGLEYQENMRPAELMELLLNQPDLKACVCRKLGMPVLPKATGQVAAALPEDNTGIEPCPCRSGKAGAEGQAGLCHVPRIPGMLTGVLTSHDPNGKSAPVGTGPAHFVASDGALTYGIAFENVAEAGAAAASVVVTDTLDPARVDLSTFELGSIHFGDHAIEPPSGRSDFAADVDLRPEQDGLVRIEAGLDAGSGVATWRFTALDADTLQPCEDPLLGVLPRNQTPPEGQGWVFFQVRPVSGLVTGTTIQNQASIVFDVNDPILTDTVTNTLDAGAPVSAVGALPAYSAYPEFTVSWSGTDDAGGSGVASYDLFTATDGGAFTVWLSGSPDTSAVFPGERGHTYSFYAIARDAVGHTEVQAGPIVAEAQTRVPLLTDDTDGDGLPDWFEALAINASPNDAYADFADVTPGGDCDSDGASNLHEYRAETDPTDAREVPAGVAPDGEFLLVVDAADVAAGLGLWDLTGTYVTAVKGYPLTLDLLHDTKGKLGGTATCTVAKDTTVTMPIKGSVKGASGSITMQGTLKGADPAKTVSVSLKLALAVDATNRRLGGPLTGSVKANGATTAVNQNVALDIPAPMDGTWTLLLTLTQGAKGIAGTATLALSNGADYALVVKGKAGAAGTAVLSLAGASADPAAKAIKIKTAITPLAGHWAELEALAGKAYGQSLQRR